ncbi:Arachidonate 12-lipoxygenase, 12R-type [Amphibalanus amphitrite]|uniref:Arachidonate 12-lipoxygenase, 12R-type n=1 Tax=Amphibalanus amphitrite TaxID=1232801 RepID=A0A6A4VTF7_AMPAM|nr:Arachidonate 12-lipoxygenase, 12R-type [Amphibalanus amphitrite]
MMMATARSAFSEAVIEKVKERIEEQPCVSVLADKVTVARRTVDITAVLMLMPNAEPDEIFQSFVVGAPIVKQHDGDGLAADIRDTLKRVGVVASEQVSAVAADGQYHHNDVPAKLARMLDGHSVFPAVWDHSHLMNLAESDVRKAAEMAWVQDVVDLMTAVSKRFSIGKGWEDLVACGEKRGQRPLRPKLWSETRFAAHAAQVITVFRRNLPLLCAALEERLDAEEAPRAAQLNEMKKELAQLKDATFEIRLRALEDIYSVLATHSKGVQSTRALPWERQASQTKLVDLLERMRVALVAQFKKTPAVSELLDVSEKEELWPSLLQNRATPPATEVAKVARYCSKLTERLQFRGRGQDKGGSQKGTSNGAIADSMDDIRCVADIQQVAVSNTPPQILARQVHEASMRLAGRKLVPLSSVPTARQIEAGIVLLRGHKARTSPELWKALVDQRGGDPEARNYGNLGMLHWKSDKWFGIQRLQGVNPVLIKLCTKIPDNLNVDDTMLRPFLETLTIEEAIQSQKLFLVDLGIVEGVPPAPGTQLCAPMGLFYLNKNSELLPVAIQLFQHKGGDNLVRPPVRSPHLTTPIWHASKHHQRISRMCQGLRHAYATKL